MKDRVYQHSFNHAAYGWGIAMLVIKSFNTLWVVNIFQTHNSLEEMIHPIILLIKGYPKVLVRNPSILRCIQMISNYHFQP